MALKITSSAFADGAAIPAKYTCEGEDLSPPLAWTGVPAGANSLVLIVDDPDAPDPKAPRMTYVHWVLYDLPPDSSGLAEDVDKLPTGAQAGKNDWRRADYGGPCPPIGRHRYFFKLYALDTKLSSLVNPTKLDVVTAMQGHVLAEAQTVGTYQKSK
jgi:Raf kinase inhibitor-like YbhB/YbcL family protein